MASTQAGTDFVTSERRVRELRTRLGIPEDQTVPHFEVLLRTTLVTSIAAGPEWVAHRVLAP